MTNTINHITFIVNDIHKSARIFTNLFGAEIVYDSGNTFHSFSKELFLTINNIWIALMQGNDLIEKSYNHIAFSIQDHLFNEYLKKIEQLGLTIIESRSRIQGEGKSIYFYDYDNHLFELHTGNLEERIKSYNEKD